MKRNKKLFFAALSVLMVMVVSVAILSFTRADENNKGTFTEGNDVVAANIDTNTNIDNIIEFSNGAALETPSATLDDSQIYKIVEIGSSSTPSSLKAFVESTGFENYVINGNRTIADLMNSNCIDYKYYSVADLDPSMADFDSKKAIISNADFIYVSYDSTVKYNAATNDIPDSVVDILKKHATSDYKPLIIDSPTNSGNTDDVTKDLFMGNVAKIYNTEGKYYYTFAWDKALSANDFVNHLNGSLYLPIGGGNASSRWYTHPETNNTIAKMLVVSDGGANNGMSNKLLNGLTPEDLALASETDVIYDKYKNLYKVDNTNLLYALYSANGVKPAYVKFETASLSDLESAAGGYLDQYDLVIIESDVAGKKISKDLYNSLVGALYAKKNIIYDKDISSTTSTGGTITTTGLTDTNYYEIFACVASTKEEPLYENVMVANIKKIDVIANSNSSETDKIIADLINKSAFRGIGGQGSSSNMFTVLELQPCYPIDLTLAAKNKDYYKIPSDVIKGKTKEELAAGTEYYAFELSKAKIAHALNIDAEQINLIQMSTEEFAGYKEDILGNVDLVYIGGNTSALKDLKDTVSLVCLLGWDKTIANVGGSPPVTLDSLVTAVPMYGMYTHSGTIVNVNLMPMSQSPGPASSGTPTASVVIGGSTKESFSTLNGNDITYNGYERLKEYIDAGMPVIVSDDASTAYETLLTKGKQNQKIDPDSNMAKVIGLAYAINSKNSNASVAWNFDKDNLASVSASDGNFGKTLTGYVTVYKDAEKAKLNSLYSNSSKRPKLTLISCPNYYNEYDKSTVITDGNMNFKYKLSGISSNSTVELYIDDNGNSSFSSDENAGVYGSATELEYTLSDDFYGPVYWMIKVTDNATKATVSTKGLSYVKSKNAEVQSVRVLQIMPRAGQPMSEGAEGCNTFYLCTNSQQAYERLYYNAYANTADLEALWYNGNYDQPINGYFNDDYYLGRSEYDFGVVKYDSSIVTSKGLGADDWTTNFADDISDRFDFKLDIMLANEFEAASQEVINAYNFSSMTVAQKNTIISNFSIDKTDPDYAKYVAIASTDLDAKVKFIKMREYSELSSAAWQRYQFMKTQVIADATADLGLDSTIKKTTYEAELDVRKALELMKTNIKNNTIDTTFAGEFSLTNENIIKEIDKILLSKRYSDFFSIDTRKEIYNQVSRRYLNRMTDFDGNPVKDKYGNTVRLDYYTIFKEYAKYKDKELAYYDEYKKYERLANPDNWLMASYDSVIMGAAEDFAGDDIKNDNALNDLVKYIQANGQLILFHDTLTKFSNNGTSKLTAKLRGYFGLDRYNMEMDSTANTNTYYVPYKVKSGYSTDKYFMTSLAGNSTITNASWQTDLKKVFSQYSGGKYLTNIAYTDAVQVGNSSGGNNSNAFPYKYATLSWATAAYWYNAANFTAKTNTKYGTNRATQNNKGIITMYPFTLGDKLNISGTHSQAYALDLENDDLTCWYSLAGANNTKDGSSLYAASPNDAMDSYFIYSYKNVYYCGAGHTKITGIGKDNNDERRLYINIICNSVRQSTKQPSIFIYDYEKNTNGEKILKDSSGYFTKVKEPEGYTEFSFKVITDPATTLKNIKIYYDLDYSNDNKLSNYVNDTKHVLIADWNESIVKESVRKDVGKYDPNIEPLLDNMGNPILDSILKADGTTTTTPATALKLLPEYFEPYNNEYTYIVIAATDSTGKVVYQRIKIKLADVLFNLT